MSQCRTCAADIIFGRTENGKSIPLDPQRFDTNAVEANCAGYRDHTGRIRVRALKAGEQPESYEWRAIPHFATCPTPAADTPERGVRR